MTHHGWMLTLPGLLGGWLVACAAAPSPAEDTAGTQEPICAEPPCCTGRTCAPPCPGPRPPPEPCATVVCRAATGQWTYQPEPKGTLCDNGQGVCDGSDVQCIVCPTGQRFCGGACTNVETDPNNCGACGTLCPFSPGPNVCSGGVCTCPAGLTDCGGTCRDLTKDASNCGSCGSACGVPTVCASGTCTQAVFANFGPASKCTPNSTNDNCINQNGAPIQGALVGSSCSGSALGFYSTAVSFTPAGNFTLTDVQVPLQWGLSDSNTFQIWITGSNGSGQPDPNNVLENDNFAGEDFALPQLHAVIVRSQARPRLQAGVTYWLVIAPGDLYSCGDILFSTYDTSTSTNDLFNASGSFLTGPWSGTANLPFRPAFEIDGLP